MAAFRLDRSISPNNSAQRSGRAPLISSRLSCVCLRASCACVHALHRCVSAWLLSWEKDVCTNGAGRWKQAVFWIWIIISCSPNGLGTADLYLLLPSHVSGAWMSSQCNHAFGRCRDCIFLYILVSAAYLLRVRRLTVYILWCHRFVVEKGQYVCIGTCSTNGM